MIQIMMTLTIFDNIFIENRPNDLAKVIKRVTDTLLSPLFFVSPTSYYFTNTER